MARNARRPHLVITHSPLRQFAFGVLGLYVLIWGAELAFPKSAASALALVAATAFGAWLARPGWNLRPERFGGRVLALFALLLVSGAAAAWALLSLDVPLPYGDLSTRVVLRAVPVILAITGLEELLFRQVMYRWLERRQVPARSVVLATALAFAGAHFGPILIGSSIGRIFYLLQTAYMIWIGLLLGQLRRATGSWLSSWLGHFGYNVAVLYSLAVAS